MAGGTRIAKKTTNDVNLSMAAGERRERFLKLTARGKIKSQNY